MSGKRARLRRQHRSNPTTFDPAPTLARLAAWHQQHQPGAPWDMSALLFSPEQAADAGFDTTGHARQVRDGCWLCWRYTAEAMAAWATGEPIPPAPAHWERYVRCWYLEAFE